jgi:hypothetical protein
MEKTKSTPTYANLTKVIKIVKQVFFAGNQAASALEEVDGEEKKQSAKKN